MRTQTDFSRRTFLKGTALAAGAAAMGGCLSTRKAARFRKPGEMLRLGVMVNTDDYGEFSYIALKGENKMKSITKHEACAAIPITLPRAKDQNQRREFVDACFEKTRASSDIDHSVPLVESMLVGCLAQRIPGKIKWDASKCVSDNAQANALIKPYIRAGWEY